MKEHQCEVWGVRNYISVSTIQKEMKRNRKEFWVRCKERSPVLLWRIPLNHFHILSSYTHKFKFSGCRVAFQTKYSSSVRWDGELLWLSIEFRSGKFKLMVLLWSKSSRWGSGCMFRVMNLPLWSLWQPPTYILPSIAMYLAPSIFPSTTTHLSLPVQLKCSHSKVTTTPCISSLTVELHLFFNQLCPKGSKHDQRSMINVHGPLF